MDAFNYIKNWGDVISHVLKEYPNEACGVVDMDCYYHPYPNLHSDPLHCFELDSAVYLNHQVKAIIHSHTYDLKTSNRDSRDIARSPSLMDQNSQIRSGVEWGIVVCDGEGVDHPVWWGDYNHRPPLFDREYIAGAQECVNFACDWLYQNRGIELPLQPHDENWFREGGDFIDELYKEWGFEDINITDLQEGDVVMFKLRSQVVNHLGIYIGNGQVAHHLYKRLPTVEPLAKWQHHIQRAVRYKGKNND